MNALIAEIIELAQGSEKWFEHRKKKITATDSPIIMGVSKWKTKQELYKEKKSDQPPKPPNAAQQRGIDLEPIARSLFNIQTGFNMQPAVMEKDWMMASFDGRDLDTGSILEIKCPGKADHDLAIAGKIPEHYYPQLQHQMYVAGVQSMYYFSFDGFDGVTIKVKRDDKYIEKMIEEERKFYECLQNNTPPEPDENDYIEKEDDEIWRQCAGKWLALNNTIKHLEEEEKLLRDQLIFLAGGYNAKGAGISLCKVTRKGNVAYTKMPQLKGVDVEPYRGPPIVSWRIS